ncbi:Capsule polysaccharide export protein [hydrothermal vent metagenome]|uniref:Capsule polysaccharide export protein n=1 Tax=hydrothermal vent metagenome TaxID=652676 RepID=A0A1W1D2P1_9ZZZZ
MVKVLLFMVLLFQSIYAIDQAQAISAIKANPALLNTPKAQQLMQQNGITKEEVLQKVQQSKNNGTSKTNEVNIKNDVTQSDEKKELTTQTNLNKEEKNSVSASPLQYKSEKELISSVQSQQQKEFIVPLKRYANKFFQNKNHLKSSTLQVPSYYTLNVGDILHIYIYGGENKELTLHVDNYGNIKLPILGPISVLGMQVNDAKKLIHQKLKPTYPNSKILIQTQVNSSIQVSLTGYVPAPGIYNLQSLSTIKDLLIAAHGVGNIGSIRNVYLKRDGKVLKIIDFYKLIKDGDIVDTTLLHNGDIVFIPRAKKLVRLYGDVYVPAIYEMQQDETLQNLITFSGGLKPDASNKYIKIKRFEKNSATKVFIKPLQKHFVLQNGDNIFVYKISQLHKKEIYVYGNVDKPGSYPIPKDNSLKTLLSQLQYLKNTAYNYALLQKLDDSITTFDIHHPKNIKLHPKDKIYIFNKFQIETNKYVTINGNMVKKPGKYRYLKGETLQDIIKNAKVEGMFNQHKIQITRWITGTPVLHFVDYEKNPTFKLQPYDAITLFDETFFHPLQHIIVAGEVNKPDFYTYSKSMTLKDALTMAGWFSVKANTNYIELTRYTIQNNTRKRNIYKLSDANLSFALQPFDEISVKRIVNWNEQKTVTLSGEVKYPGTYVIKSSDTLYDVIQRAGGFTKDAYLYAAVFSRQSVQKLQQKRLKDMLYKLKRKAAIIAASTKGAGETTLDAKGLLSSIDGLIEDAKNYKPIGRIALKLDENLTTFKTSPYNIILEDKDKLYVPAKKDYILVTGEVLNESAFVYKKDDANSYIEQAGGLSSDADEIYFVVHANGFSEQGDYGSWCGGNVSNLQPGDVIVVPLHIQTSNWFSITNDMSSIVYKLAITAASLKTVGAL